MWLFERKKEEKPADEQLEARLLKMNARLFKLESEVTELATAQESIRQKLLKRANFRTTSEPEEKKDLYNGMLLPEA